MDPPAQSLRRSVYEPRRRPGPRRPPRAAIAGVALILGIPALLALKAVFAGWYMAILVWVIRHRRSRAAAR